MTTSSPDRARRPSRRLRWASLALALGLLASLGFTAPATGATPYRYDLYREGDFVSQSTVYMCVGASMQMMLNMIEPKDNRSKARQVELWELARTFRRTNDPALTTNAGAINNTRRGASSRGWAYGLTRLGAGPYEVMAMPTLNESVLLAARQMRATGRPVGLLVWRGAHAWVMTGFEATGDPLTNRKARVTHVWILDPWYPRMSKTWGPGVAPHTKMTLAKVGEDWVEWRRSSNRPGLTGRWAMILPYSEWRPTGRSLSLR